MRISLAPYPHPHTQLRYTVRLKYICPIYGELITDYIFMSEEEHDDEKSYRRIMEDKMRELNTIVYDGDEVKEWESVEEIRNSLYESEILSEAVISLLQAEGVPLTSNGRVQAERRCTDEAILRGYFMARLDDVVR